MDKLLVISQSQHVEFFFQEILNRLHIVVGCLLYLFDTQRIVERKVVVDFADFVEAVFVNARQILERNVAKCYKILTFNQNAVADESEFREIVVERFGF